MCKTLRTYEWFDYFFV